MTDFASALLLIGAAVLWVPIVAFWVHVYRSEGTPQTPASGVSAPRNVPLVGPHAPDGISAPPTRDAVRPQPTAVLSDPDLSTVVAQGGRLS